MQFVQATNTPSIRELGVAEIESVNGSGIMFVPLIIKGAKWVGGAVAATYGAAATIGVAEGIAEAATDGETAGGGSN